MILHKYSAFVNWLLAFNTFVIVLRLNLFALFLLLPLPSTLQHLQAVCLFSCVLLLSRDSQSEGTMTLYGMTCSTEVKYIELPARNLSPIPLLHRFFFPFH